MATVRSSISHEERTAKEPRETGIHLVNLSSIERVNDNIRLLRLSAARQDEIVKVSAPKPL